jgi:hypothetical protein
VTEEKEMRERTYTVNTEFTDSELNAIIQGLNKYMYESPYITDEGYEIACRAMDKILDAVE